MEELNIGLLTVKRLFQLCIQKLSCREQPRDYPIICVNLLRGVE